MVDLGLVPAHIVAIYCDSCIFTECCANSMHKSAVILGILINICHSIIGDAGWQLGKTSETRWTSLNTATGFMGNGARKGLSAQWSPCINNYWNTKYSRPVDLLLCNGAVSICPSKGFNSDSYSQGIARIPYMFSCQSI